MKWTRIIAVVVALAACVLAYASISQVHDFVSYVVTCFASGDFSKMREFIASYGAAAAVVSFFLMIFQSVIAPLPAFVLTVTNANLFGWWQGAILSWSSAMAGAALCFWIARILGQDAVEKLITKAGLQQVDRYFERHGSKTVLVCRLLPFVSFDYVSYAAGLTSMSFKDFMIATGIGQLPATIVYSYVGGMLTGGAKWLVTGLLILFAMAVVVVIIKQVYAEVAKRKTDERTADDDADAASAPARDAE